MKIFFAALFDEVSPVIKKFNFREVKRLNKRQAVYQSDSVFFFITGVGWKNLEKAVSYFFLNYTVKNISVYLVGYAGAVANNLKIGHIIKPSLIQSHNDIVRISNDNNIILYDENRVFFKPDKIKLKKIYPDVSAVDMESYKFVSLMNKYKIENKKVIKVISDTINTVLPDIKTLKYSLKDIFKMSLSNYVRLVKFKYNMKIASKKLSDVLSELIYE